MNPAPPVTSILIGLASLPCGRRRLPEPLDLLERDAILDTLKRTGGNKTQTARLLGIGLRTLHRKLKIYRYDDPESDQERSSV